MERYQGPREARKFDFPFSPSYGPLSGSGRVGGHDFPLFEEAELGQGREGGDEALIPNHGLLGHDEA